MDSDDQGPQLDLIQELSIQEKVDKTVLEDRIQDIEDRMVTQSELDRRIRHAVDGAAHDQSALEQTIYELAEEIDFLQARTKRPREDELKQHVDQIADELGDVRQLVNQLEAHGKETDTTEVEAERLEDRLDTIAKTQEALADRVDTLAEQRQRHEQRLARLEQHHESHTDRVADLEDHISTVTDAISGGDTGGVRRDEFENLQENMLTLTNHMLHILDRRENQ